MNRQWKSCCSIAVAASLVFLSACVERKEHLTISPEGRLLWQVEHATDSLTELYEGDAVPRLGGGWLADQKEKNDDEGKVTYTLTAEASFAARAVLPANYALPGDADADLYLQFPTTLKMERRRDGTYYHFARTYKPRAWAKIEFYQKQLVEEPLADLKDVDPAQWSDEQRMKAVQALGAFELQKMLVLARAAFQQALPESPQDGWLAVQRDLTDFVGSMDYQTMAQLIQPKSTPAEEEKRNKEIEAEAKKFEAATVQRLQEGLKNLAGCDAAHINAFLASYQRQKKTYEITQDLNDDHFKITIDMPGEIIASNADNVDGKNAKWEFDGTMLHDREIELLATARVAK